MGFDKNRKIYNYLPLSKKTQAVTFLKLRLKDKDNIREAIARNPERWWVNYHLCWGAGVKDMLRVAGFAEEFFEIKNINSIYIELVEDSLGLYEEHSEEKT